MNSSSSQPIWRIITVAVMLAAWFGLSNHCALAIAMGQPIQVAGPNSADCEQCPHRPAPSKHAPAGDDSAPCCKQLKVTKNAEWVPNISVGLLTILPVFLSNGPEMEIPKTQPVPDLCDTGPPGTLSEIVFKRCTRSNAPPLA